MRNLLIALSLAVALPAPALAENLVGATFHVESVAGARVAPRAATFQILPDGRIGGSGGCNRYGGTGKLAGGEATIGAIVSTRMACAPDLMAQEQALFEALRKTTRYATDGDALTLRDAAGAVLVRLRRG